jgi:hypothetical protein
VIIADKFADSKGVWLTANDSTIYALNNVDLGKSGPVVVDVPPGAIVGLPRKKASRSTRCKPNQKD